MSTNTKISADSANTSLYEVTFDILNTCDIGLVLLDRNKQILLWNNWLANRSRSKTRTIGLHFFTLFTELQGSEVEEAVNNCLSKGETTELTRLTLDFMQPVLNIEENFKRTFNLTVKPLPCVFDNNACVLEIVDTTELSQTEEKLAGQVEEIKALIKDSSQSTLLSKALYETSNDILLTIDDRGRVKRTNQVAMDFFGMSRQEFDGELIQSLLEKTDHSMILPETDFVENLEQAEFTALKKDKSRTPIKLQSVRVESPGIKEILLVLHDNSALRNLQKEFDSSEMRYTTAINSVSDALIITDVRGSITQMNHAAQQLTAWSRQHAVGQPLHKIINLVEENTLDPISPYELTEKLVESRSTGSSVNITGTALLSRQDRYRVPVEYSITRLDPDPIYRSGLVIVMHDVTHKRQAQRKLAWQSTHDILTHLINRSEFENRVGLVTRQAKADNSENALLYIDLDQFKIVNDTWGHVAGDEVLRQISQLLRTTCGHTAIIARLGGDEFGVLLPNCPQIAAEKMAQDIRDSIRNHRFCWNHNPFSLSASIGLAMINAHSENMTSLLSNADTACVAAKDSGRNRVLTSSPENSELMVRRGEMQWVSRLQSALDNDKLQIYGQPIVPIGSREANLKNLQPRIEILMRLKENGEIISPAHFISAAERYDLMPALDRWVIQNTFRFYSRKDREKCLPININISGKSLSDNSFLFFIMNCFNDYRIEPEFVCFEITETATIGNLASASNFMQVLRKLGCEFALDDFGSGLSSFAYLKQLPIDYLKIDGTFVRDAHNNQVDLAMLDAINTIGQVMGIHTIAEYVESEELVKKLDEIGIDYIQGYSVSKPLPIEKLVKKKF